MPGLNLLERRTGDADATVICVHGGLDRGGSFARMARRLEGIDVVAYDRRGYQGSRSLVPLDLAHHVQDLLSVARSEVAAGRSVLTFGHSYGGVVAIGAALKEPELFTAVQTYEPPLPWIYSREGGFGELHPDPAEEAELFFRRMVSDAAWERLGEDGRAGRRADGPAIHNDLSTLRGSAPFDLSTLATPFGYGYGSEPSRVEYYQEVARRIRGLLPTAVITEVANAGHGAHLSAPEHMVALIDTWRKT